MDTLKIYNKEGDIIHKSKNLRGIREHVSKYPVKHVILLELQVGGKLIIEFKNDDYFECEYADFIVLKWSIRNWRNLYGAKLSINWIDNGKVSYHNSGLKG